MAELQFAEYYLLREVRYIKFMQITIEDKFRAVALTDGALDVATTIPSEKHVM